MTADYLARVIRSAWPFIEMNGEYMHGLCGEFMVGLLQYLDDHDVNARGLISLRHFTPSEGIGCMEPRPKRKKIIHPKTQYTHCVVEALGQTWDINGMQALERTHGFWADIEAQGMAWSDLEWFTAKTKEDLSQISQAHGKPHAPLDSVIRQARYGLHDATIRLLKPEELHVQKFGPADQRSVEVLDYKPGYYRASMRLDGFHTLMVIRYRKDFFHKDIVKWMTCRCPIDHREVFHDKPDPKWDLAKPPIIHERHQH